MKKYLILHIIDSLARGGAEIRLLEDIKNLTEFNHQVCYFFNYDELKNDFHGLGVQTHCLSPKYPYSILGFFIGYVKLLGLVNRLKPDIIHTHLFFANISARLIGLLYPRIKYFQTIHYPDYKKSKDNAYIYSLPRHVLELFTFFLKKPHFIAVSEYVKGEAIKSLGLKEKEVAVIYNYLDDAWFNNGMAINQNRYPKRLISIGRLHEQKGIEYLIKAMKIVVDSGRQVQLSIVGDGPQREYLTNLAGTLNLKTNILFLGRKSNVKDLILENDIFVFPSLDEGLGIALIEAMSQERLCIAFKTGPIPEIIEHGIDGFLVPLKDTQALAGRIIYAIDNYPVCKEMTRKARQKIMAIFCRGKSVKLLRDYYLTKMNKN